MISSIVKRAAELREQDPNVLKPGPDVANPPGESIKKESNDLADQETQIEEFICDLNLAPTEKPVKAIVPYGADSIYPKHKEYTEIFHRSENFSPIEIITTIKEGTVMMIQRYETIKVENSPCSYIFDFECTFPKGKSKTKIGKYELDITAAPSPYEASIHNAVSNIALNTIKVTNGWKNPMQIMGPDILKMMGLSEDVRGKALDERLEELELHLSKMISWGVTVQVVDNKSGKTATLRTNMINGKVISLKNRKGYEKLCLTLYEMPVLFNIGYSEEFKRNQVTSVSPELTKKICDYKSRNKESYGRSDNFIIREFSKHEPKHYRLKVAVRADQEYCFAKTSLWGAAGIIPSELSRKDRFNYNKHIKSFMDALVETGRWAEWHEDNNYYYYKLPSTKQRSRKTTDK